MKIRSLFILMILAACNTEEDPQIGSNALTGTWQLIAVLADPGDGSGTFTPVTSDQTLTLSVAGTVISNNGFCASANDQSQKGTYLLDNGIGSITPEDCPDRTLPINIEEGNLFVGNPACIEPCRAKYRRIN